MLNILLAEDDRNFGIVMKSELEEEAYTVDLVNDGVEAVLYFIDNFYDFVLIDFKMPKLDGISALRIIRKKNRTCLPSLHPNAFFGVDGGLKTLHYHLPLVRADTSNFTISSLGSLKFLTLISSSFTNRYGVCVSIE